MPDDEADTLILGASELLTLSGPARPRVGEGMKVLGDIRDGALAIKDCKIIAVGETHMIRSKFKSANVVLDATGKLVMPGFVDCHNHLVFAGSREEELEMKLQGMSYLDIAKKGGGILRTVQETRAASSDHLQEEGKRRLDMMLEFGTTTAEAKSGYGLNLDDEVKMLKVVERLNDMHFVDLVPTFIGAHALAPEYRDYEQYTNALVEHIIPAIAIRKIAEFCDVFCDMGFFSVEQSRRILKKAQSYRMRAKIHADELAETGGTELAAEIGAVSAEHLNFPSSRGLRMMAEKSVIGVLLPASTYSMMSRDYTDARRIIKAGVPVALGTDLTPNSWTESMQFVISLACHHFKMLPSEVIVASTINAAHAISRAHEIGSLEVGKLADIIILDVPNHKHLPYHSGVNLVERVIKRGTVVV